MVRKAKKEDVCEIVSILAKAFHRNDWEPGGAKYNEKISEVLKHINEYLVLEENKKIIGTCHIRKDKLKIGKAVIIKGDVGYVSILPEYQGRGYGSKLMKEAVLWMKKKKYDISRLGGLIDFYKRFGYIRFPRRWIEFTIGQKVPAGASFIEENEIPIEDKFVKSIRPFDPKKDTISYIKLVKKFQSRYNGSLITGKSKNVSINPIFFVFVEKGKVVGYLSGCRYEKSVSGIGAECEIYDIGYEREKPYVLQSLIKYINNFAFKEGISRMTARLPFDPEIIKLLTEIPIRFQVIENYGGKAGNMIQIINIQSLFQRLSPELEDRLKNSVNISYKGVLEIKIEKDSVQLEIDKGHIKVVEGKKPSISIEIPEFYLIQLILGLLSFEEIRDLFYKEKLTSHEVALLNTLFPRRLVYSGYWG